MKIANQTDYNPLAVANWFIEKSNTYGQSLSAKKCHRLMYFAQGIYLGHHGRPFIATFFEAKEYGPVVPRMIAHFGSKYWNSPIKEYASEVTLNNRGSVSIRKIEANFDPNATKVMECVWQNFGHMSDKKLGELINKKDSPWEKAMFSTNKIQNDDMIIFFKQFIKQPTST